MLGLHGLCELHSHHQMRGLGSSNGRKTGVYGGVLVRYVDGNLYLDMELATESELADTEEVHPLFLLLWYSHPHHQLHHLGRQQATMG